MHFVCGDSSLLLPKQISPSSPNSSYVIPLLNPNIKATSANACTPTWITTLKLLTDAAS